MTYKIVKGNSFFLHVYLRMLKQEGNMIQIADYDLSQAKDLRAQLVGSFSRTVNIEAKICTNGINDLLCAIPPTLDIDRYAFRLSWADANGQHVAIERNIITIVSFNSQSYIPLGIIEGERSGLYDLRFEYDNAKQDESHKQSTNVIDITDSLTPLDMGLSDQEDSYINIDTYNTIQGGTYLIVDNNNRDSDIEQNVITGILYVFKDYANSILTQVLHSNYGIGSFGDSSTTAYTTQYRFWQNNEWTDWKSVITKSDETPTGYTVTYNTNGHGTAPTKLTNVTKLPSPLPTLSATGYTFDGWYTNSALTTKAVAGSTITSDTTLYAKWSVVVTGYTVTYNTNGHGTAPTKLTNVTKLPSPLPTLSATGYTFDGWYTNSALTTKAVAGSTITSDTTLYAKWSVVVTGYTVTYNTNGHGTAPTKLTNVTKLPSPLPTLSATGYTFDGWYTNSALTTKAVAGSTITSDTTLYAKWSVVVTGYTVTYNANGYGSTPTKLTNVTKLPSTLPTLSASGYTFGGWYTDSALTIKAVAGSTISSNITLYAKWTEIASVYIYTGNTATTPTDEEVLQGTKYDYNTTKSFTTPQMVSRSIWVCLPATVTLVSMENVNFSGDFLINTSTGINKLSTRSLTIEGVQYTLYYLTTIPSKNPYKTIVK